MYYCFSEDEEEQEEAKEEDEDDEYGEAPTMLCKDKHKNDVVQDIIAKLKEIEVDGETMEYILDQVGMLDQMAKQLLFVEDNAFSIDDK